MFPKLLSLGNFFLPTYGLLVAAAFLIGLWLSQKLARRSGLDPEKIANLAVYCALTGLLGAKLLMFVFDWHIYSLDPASIFSLSTLMSAGVFHGGLVLALAFAVVYLRRQKMPFLASADVLAPGLTMGHAIGRLGCFAAGCCWGTRCDRPWAVTFRSRDAEDLTGVPLGVPLHPAQLYEMALLIGLFFFLWKRFARPHPPGRILAEYLVYSSLIRFGVEFFRAHAQALPFGGPFSLTQWISIFLAILGIVLWTKSMPQAASTAVRAQ